MRAGVEIDFCLANQALFKLFDIDAQSLAKFRTIHPCQVRTFERHDGPDAFDGKQFFTEELVILGDIFSEFRKPILRLFVGCDGSDHAEGIDIAHLVDIDGAVDAAAQRRVGTYDVGDLQTCDIERLRR